ncbi:hypothetical protein BH11CYA1_BH11CYA1_46920 [soil metagenome]
MGLSVKVGLLSQLLQEKPRDAESLQYELGQINKELSLRGLALHNEPTELTSLKSRSNCQDYSYDSLKALQRFAANLFEDPNWIPTPLAEGEDADYDSAVIEQSLLFESHLLCHPPSEGYCLPIDFDEVIVSDVPDIPGSFLCSSYAFMRDLIAVAPALGITLLDGSLSDEQADLLNRVDIDSDLFAMEKLVWLSLFEAARLSIENKSVIRFASANNIEYLAEGFELLVEDLSHMAKYLLDDQAEFLPFASVVTATGETAYMMLEDNDPIEDVNLFLQATVVNLRSLVDEESCSAIGICIATTVSNDFTVPFDALHCVLEHRDGSVQSILVPYVVRETGAFTLKPAIESGSETSFNVFGADFAPGGL